MRSMRWALTGVVFVLASCGGGSSSNTSEESPTSTVVETEVVYKVGDTGPGGGIIVYVDEAGFTSEQILGCGFEEMCHYIEMAPSDLDGSYTWLEATKVVLEYSTATADDWFLPSMNSLNQICKYAFGDTVNEYCNENGTGQFMKSVGGFADDFYWTVEQESGAVSYVQSFYEGVDYTGGNIQTASVDRKHRVRPVRVF